MKYSALALLMVTPLAGCVNLYAGIARYDVKPFYDPVAKVEVCCEATVTSGKNVKSMVAHIARSTDGSMVVDFTEDGVVSSKSITAATVGVSSVSSAVVASANAAAQFAPATVVASAPVSTLSAVTALLTPVVQLPK